MSLMQFLQTKMNLWDNISPPPASNRDCDVVCASLYYIADTARVANEKSVLRTFYLFKLASSSKLDEKSGINFAALRRTQLSILKMKSFIMIGD